jgi:uncharacterized protein YabE (DUF348 family)
MGSIPYTSSQNGVTERTIQTTENNVRAMLKEAGLPLELWDGATRVDSYLRNRTSVGLRKVGTSTFACALH